MSSSKVLFFVISPAYFDQDILLNFPGISQFRGWGRSGFWGGIILWFGDSKNFFLSEDPAIRSARLVKITMTEPRPSPPPPQTTFWIPFCLFYLQIISASLLWATQYSPLIQLKIVNKRCQILRGSFVSYI